jgi:hypothetical protein
MEVTGHIHTPATLPPIKEPRYPFSTRLSGPSNRSELFEEQKNLLPSHESNCQSLLFKINFNVILLFILRS